MEPLLEVTILNNTLLHGNIKLDDENIGLT